MRLQKPRNHPLEKTVEAEILDYLNQIPKCKAWKNRSMGTFNMAKKTFIPIGGKYNARGTSDIIGIYKGKMLCIEVKSKVGKLSQEQADFLITMKLLGAISFVARSLDDVTHHLLGLEVKSQQEEATQT